MAKKQRKPLTGKEKLMRKKIRADMREKGILPPVKKPLNRRKFADEIQSEWKNAEYFDMVTALSMAIALMIPTPGSKVSGEQVGILKVMKATLEISKKWQEARNTGKDISYTDLYRQVVRPIEEM